MNSYFNSTWNATGKYNNCDNNNCTIIKQNIKITSNNLFDKTPFGVSINPTNYNSDKYPCLKQSTQTKVIEHFYEAGRTFSNDETPTLINNNDVYNNYYPNTNPHYGNFYGGDIALKKCYPSNTTNPCSELGKYWEPIRQYDGLCNNGVRYDCQPKYPTKQSLHNKVIVKNGSRLVYQPIARGNGINIL